MAGRKEPGCTPLRQAPEEFIRCNDDTASRVGVPSENCTRRTPQNTKFFKGGVTAIGSDSANPISSRRGEPPELPQEDGYTL